MFGSLTDDGLVGVVDEDEFSFVPSGLAQSETKAKRLMKGKSDKLYEIQEVFKVGPLEEYCLVKWLFIGSE